MLDSIFDFDYGWKAPIWDKSIKSIGFLVIFFFHMVTFSLITTPKKIKMRRKAISKVERKTTE